MGKSYTFPYAYRLVFSSEGGRQQFTDGGWRVRGSFGNRGFGQPTAQNLEQFAQDFEASTLPGGCNAHLGKCVIWAAFITENNAKRTVLVEYRGPSFAIV